MRRVFTILVAALAACSDRTPGATRLTSISPAQVAAGSRAAVRIEGENLLAQVETNFRDPAKSAIQALFSAQLIPSATEQPIAVLESVQLIDAHLVATVPNTLATDVFDLRVVDP